MEFVLKMLRSRLRTERLHKMEADLLLVETVAINKKEEDSIIESLNQAKANIPQLEKAIKILSEWKDK